MKTKKSISVAIMTHPDRIHLATELRSQIRNGEIVGIHQDSLWGAAKIAWLGYDPSKTHHMVIQDDVWANKTLVSDVEYLLNLFDEDVLLSLTDIRPEDGYLWRKSYGTNNARALVLPTSFIADWIMWCEKNVLPDFRPDDIRLTMYLFHRRIPLLFPNPPLVYQRNVYSIYKDREADDREWEFIGNTGIESFNWDDGAVKDYTGDRLKPSMMHTWAKGKLILQYMPESVFPEPDVIELTNVIPFKSLLSKPNSIGTNNKTALFIPPFDETPFINDRLLEVGEYRFAVHATMAHVLNGTSKPIPEDAKNHNVTVYPGGGAGVVELWIGDTMVHQLKIGLYFNTSHKNEVFIVSVDKPSIMKTKVWSHLWGNLAVKFNYRFEKIEEV